MTAETALESSPQPAAVPVFRQPVWPRLLVLIVGLSVLPVAGLTAWLLVKAGTAIGLIALVVAAILLPAAVLICVLFFWQRSVGQRGFGLRAGGLSGELTPELDIIRRAFDSLGSPRAIIGPRGHMTYANAQFIGLMRRSMVGKLSGLEALLGGDKEQIRRFAEICRSAGTGVPDHADFYLHLPGGGEWRRIEAAPVEAYAGYFALRVEDISTQRGLAEVLKQEQRRFVDFVDSAPIGFYSADADGRFTYMNQTLSQWLGMPVTEIAAGRAQLGQALWQGGPAGAPPHDPLNGRASGEAVLRAADGQPLPVQLIQNIEKTATGLNVHTIVRDLRSELQWREALEQTELRLQRLFEEAPLGVALMAPDGTLRRTNQTLARMLGAGDAPLAPQPLAAFFAEEPRARLANAVAATLSGTVPDAPFDISPAARPDLVMSVSLNRAGIGQGPDGAESGAIVLYAVDTTEQRNLEKQIAQSQKMQAIGQLAGGIAHDFNNLLTAMIGFCDLLLMRHKPGEQSFADIMQIKQNANRAADLVRQLLAFSRQQTLKAKVLRVTDVLMDISHLLRRLVGSSITLNLVHGRDLGRIRVDQGQLEQVIINLVVNARDAMPDGGEIEVRTANHTLDMPQRVGEEDIPPGDYLSIAVADQGIGISRDNLQRIFEPFFSTKDVGSGTGLGLSTVYGIVRQTGGYVLVDSEEGKGSVFTILLPTHVATEADVLAEAPTLDAEPPTRDLTGAGRILLVEDEEAVRLFSSRALRNKGYTVHEAQTGQVALDMLHRDGLEVDLMITDIVMPEMDGTTLIRAVRERLPHLKVICMSGYAEDTFRRKLDEDKDVTFLPKPFSLNQLASVVKDVIDR